VLEQSATFLHLEYDSHGHSAIKNANEYGAYDGCVGGFVGGPCCIQDPKCELQSDVLAYYSGN